VASQKSRRLAYDGSGLNGLDETKETRGTAMEVVKFLTLASAALFLIATPEPSFADSRLIIIDDSRLRLKDIGSGTNDTVEISVERDGETRKSISVNGVKVSDAKTDQDLKLCTTCQNSFSVIALTQVLRSDSDTFDLSNLSRDPLKRLVILDQGELFLVPIENVRLGFRRLDGVTPIVARSSEGREVELEWIDRKLFRQISATSDLFAAETGKILRSEEEAEPEDRLPGGAWSQSSDWIVAMSSLEPYDCVASASTFEDKSETGVIVGSDRRTGLWSLVVGSTAWEGIEQKEYSVQYIVDGKPALDGTMMHVGAYFRGTPYLFQATLDDESFRLVSEELSKGSTFRLRVYDVSESRRVLNSPEISLRGSAVALSDMNDCINAEGIMKRPPLNVPFFGQFVWED
jgi:hypothetical protein